MDRKLGFVITLLVVGAVGLAACGPFVLGPTEKTVYVGPYLVECEGVAPQQCMLVKDDPEGDWTLFYDRIEGFDYEEGYEYELLVSEQEIDNPPADASSIKWTLVEVVSKTASLEGTNWVLDSYLNSEGVLAGLLPDTQISAKFQDGQVSGNAGCNSYFGSYELGDGSLEIGMLGMTEMYCFPEEVMDQEGQYLADLGRAASYKLEGDRLEIADAEGNTMLTYSTLKPLPLVDTQWQLTSYNNGKGGVVSVLVGTEITALFSQDGHMSGSAGCNNYNAAYEVEGDRITIGPAASTMMMCPGPEGLMEQEQTYLAALESVASYRIEGDNLELRDASGQAMLSYTVRQSAPLVGPTWQLTAYNNGKEAVVSVLSGTEITARFGEDGNLAGSAGCNNYNASYQVEGGAIQFGPAMSTRMYCAEPEGIMEQETAYLAALEMAATYQIEGDRLLLRSAEGARVAEYVVKAETGLSEDELKNMEYKSEWTQSGVAPLANGEYREQAAPGSATETIVLLSPWIASGELNGEPAVAAILITDPGGSGTFYDLAVVVERDGQPVNVASTHLGDRIQINSLDIENNQIIVDMISHGPDDPMCCPTQQVIETYELQGEELVETSSQADGGGSDLVGVVWNWEKLEESNDNIIVVDDPGQYTLEFLPEGQVSVKADCNNGNGTYEVSGNLITIDIMAVTMAMCPPDSLSDQYLKDLGEVVSYMIKDGKLALALKYDSGIMTFSQ